MAGIYFEDFRVAAVYHHEASRSVTEFDNIWASCMHLNTQPLHLNFDFSEKKGAHNKPLFNSLYTLAIVIGQSSQDLTRGTLMENVLITDIEFPLSVFAGDTLYSRTTVKSLGPDTEHADAGMVEFLHEGRNQNGEIVTSFTRKVLVRKRGSTV